MLVCLLTKVECCCVCLQKLNVAIFSYTSLMLLYLLTKVECCCVCLQKLNVAVFAFSYYIADTASSSEFGLHYRCA